MGYTGNYLGQTEQIIYPDDEQINYEYDHGGQIRRVTGLRENTEFIYVDNIGYDEFGQRTFIRYGNGVSTRYSYDEKRRWLLRIQTEQDERVYQNISYDFDSLGNIQEYANAAGRYTTQQRYTYDGLYQLTGVSGTSRQYLYSGGSEEAYTASYSQNYYFDPIGNMTRKISRGTMTNNVRMGSDLNYDMAYRYYRDYAHRAEQIGDLYYQYDENGNLLVERFGDHAGVEPGRPVYYEDGVYSTDYGFALTAPRNETVERRIYQRNYTWDYRNQLIRTKDNRYTVRYRYGADGRRALKYTEENRNETLYYNNMWQMSMTSADSRWLQSKHIFVGNSRIATKSNYEGEHNLGLETNHQYWYHEDHIGSAQMITNSTGKQHERIEYTPYGETWIEHRYDEDTLSLPYRFTGKELDEETGFYYYGARYMDPKTSRWLSADPAMGEYIPAAPVNDEARKRNGNLPGMGGVYNLVNLHVYHYAGNNPVKYVDPDGDEIMPFVATFNMSDRKVLLGNSPSETISGNGCYITTFANIGYALYIEQYEGNNYGSERKTTVMGINSLKGIFKTGSGDLNGSAMDTIFGEGRWNYFTKGGQADKGGLSARLKELDESGQKYMIAGIFDLSSVNKDVPNHMVGITGLPGEDGVFDTSMIVPTSGGDRIRLGNNNSRSAYNMDNLKEIRVILVD
jgi:RHS repeat-associated protein